MSSGHLVVYLDKIKVNREAEDKSCSLASSQLDRNLKLLTISVQSNLIYCK